MMDSLLLLAVKKVMKCPVNNGRAFLGGAIGAILTCLLVVFPLPSVVNMLVGYVGINCIMVRAGLNLRWGRGFLKAFGLLYVAAFLLGGILQALRPWIRAGSIFFAVAVAAYYLLCGIWQCLLRLGRRQAQICEVILHIGEGTYQVQALVDTGNGLTDPLSGEPVSVLDSDCAGQILGEEKENTGIRYIPYRTVGGEGVMPVFRAEQMEVCLMEGGGKIQMQRPVIGICEGKISEQEDYQMILNPEILAH